MIPFVLFNNTCLSIFFNIIDTCPKNSTLNFVNEESFECKLIEQCSSLIAKEKSTQLMQCKTCGGKDVCFESC